jgi:hypothetical protein
MERHDMAEPRSPGYPGISLTEAIELAKKIHSANRTNPLGREAAAKEMGYNGLNGRSAKVLSDLSHFGLLEKAGSGQVRVTKLAVAALYPESEEARLEALHTAATNPTLFAELNAYFDDGLPSEHALRSYLMRNSFASAAIAPIMASYLETYRSLGEPIVSGGHGQAGEKIEESERSKNDASLGGQGGDKKRQSPPPGGGRQQREIPLMEGERVIFADEVRPGQYLKLVASGPFDATLFEGLKEFAARWQTRFTPTQSNKEPSHDESEETAGSADDTADRS